MIHFISQEGKEFLRLVEGISLLEYPDSGGEPTIGVGHLLTRDERLSGKIKIAGKWVDYRNGLTPNQVDALHEQDLAFAIRAVNNLVTVPLTQNQFDALVSFVFNIGVSAFANSTLLRLLNKGNYYAVPGQLKRWVYDNGRIVQGLVNRREKEIDLWNGPQVTVAV